VGWTFLFPYLGTCEGSLSELLERPTQNTSLIQLFSFKLNESSINTYTHIYIHTYIYVVIHLTILSILYSLMTVWNISMDCWSLLTRQGQRNWWKTCPSTKFQPTIPHGLPWEWTLGIQDVRLVTNCLRQKYTLIEYIELIVNKMFYKEVVIHIFLQYDMFCMYNTLIIIKCNLRFCAMLILMQCEVLTTWKTLSQISQL
jgi:hypothetical protein